MPKQTTQSILSPEQQSLKNMILSAMDDARSKNIRTDLLKDLVFLHVF